MNKDRLVLGDKGKCCYCGGGEYKMTIDHFVPYSHNSGSILRVWSCKRCNSIKRDKTPEEFATYLMTDDTVKNDIPLEKRQQMKRNIVFFIEVDVYLRNVISKRWTFERKGLFATLFRLFYPYL